MSEIDAVDALIQALDGACRLLENVGEDFWGDKLQMGRKRVAEGDAYALRQLEGTFGGMGSFNDLVIHPINGHDVEPHEVDHVNRRLDVLRGTIARRTRELIREIEQR